MNNQTSVSSAFVNLSSRIISYPPISFSFNLSLHLFLCAVILFFFHYLPLFLSFLLLTFVFMLSAWFCISAATVIRRCRRPKDAFALSFSPESLLIWSPITLTQSEGTHQMLMQSYLSGIPFSRKLNSWVVSPVCDHNCGPVGADFSQGSLNVLLRLGVQGRRGLETQRYSRCQVGQIGVAQPCRKVEPRKSCTGVTMGGLVM